MKQYRVWRFVLGMNPEITAEMEIVEANSWGILGSEEITPENEDWDNDFHRIFN